MYLFNMFMSDLLIQKSRDIYRSKGILAVHGQDDKKFIFQGVHETMNFGPANETWKEGEKPSSVLVFIGRNLDRHTLEENLRMCLWKPLPAGWRITWDTETGKRMYSNKALDKTQEEFPTE